MAQTAQLSSVYPLGSTINDLGHLEIGGCDTIELAREFGTPAYVVATEDMIMRSRRFVTAATGLDGRSEVLFASKAFPCTAVLELFAREGLFVDVASEGELHLARHAGFEPERIVMHGNAKSEAELRACLRDGVGLIVVDNDDELTCLGELLAETGATQDVLLRVTPDVSGDTHEKISTGQARSKFGFSMDAAPAAIERALAIEGMRLRGLHAHVGSQLVETTPWRRAAEALASLARPEFDTYDLGGGLGVRYTDDQPEPPSIEEYVQTNVEALHRHIGDDARLLIEPGRSLVANACVTLYTVQSVKRNVDLWVAVDGGMSDNLRPMLYGSRYEAQIADRFGGDTECVLAGKHCESGDVIVRDARLADPRAGDVVVTPATGAYGYAMANNYNGVPRPPVIFCAAGDARVVVRREPLDDLCARHV